MLLCKVMLLGLARTAGLEAGCVLVFLRLGVMSFHTVPPSAVIILGYDCCGESG